MRDETIAERQVGHDRPNCGGERIQIERRDEPADQHDEWAVIRRNLTIGKLDALAKWTSRDGRRWLADPTIRTQSAIDVLPDFGEVATWARMTTCYRH